MTQHGIRVDLKEMADWIPSNSRVLDLGCGTGDLLNYLQNNKNVTAVGVEIDNDRVVSCVQKGVPVVQQNLEDGLALFDCKQFDVVVLSQTLQAMVNTEHILKEMARVADYGIVSFPNFGHWTHWWSIFQGRMPVTGQMPYEWYNTPNIHLCTLKDFEDLAERLGLHIIKRSTYNNGKEVDFLPSWRSSLAVYYFKTPRALAGSPAAETTERSAA
ncbi:MAG: methionine biosynthesis protein MetW [Alcaligenaceae bacterium]|nr:methionine biosynthesis protein MetW [Alcaligenaceae bacterium]